MTEWTEHTITTGDDAALVLTITRNGAALNITGMTVKWTAVANRKDTTPALGPYTAALTTPLSGIATVTIPKADTAALASHAYLWDAQVTDGQGKVVTVTRGVLHVLSGITV
jgi:hypothetical protein